MTSSGNAPADTSVHVTIMGRCPRCERWLWEQRCPGVAGSIPLPPAVADPFLDEGLRQLLDEAGALILA
jgi:hypothetical protein